MWRHMLTHGSEGGNWRMEWVASTLHTTSEHGVSSITTADAHTSAASSRLNWHPRWFKWTRPFCRKMRSGLCVCAITFQMQSTYCCVYSVETPDDGQWICPKHVELFNKINLRNSASRWLLLWEYITMHGPLNVKLHVGLTLIPFNAVFKK
jgi:hypothetical protein